MRCRFAACVIIVGCLGTMGTVATYQTPADAASYAATSHRYLQVTLRPYPYPFRAMLAVESDADHMTLRKFNMIHEFINTNSESSLGRGLGLDIADSFFLYNGSNLSDVIDYNGQRVPSEMTFFKGTSHQLNDGRLILHYIRAGWIDTLHSMGDFSLIRAKGTRFSRQQAEYAIAYLLSHGVHLTVYTDHGNQSNVANFGAYGIDHFEDYQQGDNPASPYFVTDLLRKEGVRFVWADLYKSEYSYQSVIYPIHLRDGKEMWGFWRFTGTLHIYHKRRLWRYDWTDLWNPGQLAQELSVARLNHLIHTHGMTVIATHLEGNADKEALSTSAVEALTRLSHMQDRGLILVARTSRLLMYNLVHQYLRYRVIPWHGKTAIDILYVADPVDGAFIPDYTQLHGITFTVVSPQNTAILLRGVPIANKFLMRSPHTVGVKWFAPDTKNYTVWSAAQLRQKQKLVARASLNRPSSTVIGGIAVIAISLILLLLVSLRVRNGS